MLPQIDFFSYTVPNYAPHFEAFAMFAGLSRDFYFPFAAMLGLDDTAPTSAWTPVTPNRPYINAIQNPSSKARIEWGNVDTILVQLSGQACEHVRKLGHLDNIVTLNQPRATRFDLAVDMLCDTRPSEFVNSRSHHKFRSLSFFQSPEGETAYVGSWSSDRFARVYRYAAPHERSALLRAEHVFKGKAARLATLAYLKDGFVSLIASLGKVYGWTHPAWKPSSSGAGDNTALKALPRERHASKTLKWLEDQCAPALARLILSGEIEDFDTWLANNVYWRLYNRDDGSPAAFDSPTEK